MPSYKMRSRRSVKSERIRGPGFAGAPDWLKTLLKIAVVVFVLLMVDGLRREFAEVRPTLAAVSGQVTIKADDEDGTKAGKPGMSVKAWDKVTTGPDGFATLTFPDGTALQLAPGSELDVRNMDYFRGGRRDRSFILRSGSLVAHTSARFGPGSRLLISTESSVITVAPASGQPASYRVAYAATGKQASLNVYEGAVRLFTPETGITGTRDQPVLANGIHVGGGFALSPQQDQFVKQEIHQILPYDRAPGPILNAEYAVVGLGDPLFQLVGIAPGNWGFSTTGFTRRTACQEALKLIRDRLEGMGENPPEHLNLVTFEELKIQDYMDVRRLKTAFAGGILESYQKVGQEYVVRARARDARGTLFEMTPQKIGVVSGQ